jgi:dephospho-CoA kinase
MTDFTDHSNPRKPVIGLIGGIGAGKSTVAERLVELGAAVIDADRTGHEVLREPAVIERLTDTFGTDILGEDGQIDRSKLGLLVFSNKERRQKLESIVHPVMFERFVEKVKRSLEDTKCPIVVLDAAILLEVGWAGICDRIIFVDASREVRLERLRQNRGWDEAELDRREAAQWPIDKKRSRADVVIDNGTSREACRAQVDRLFEEWTQTR